MLLYDVLVVLPLIDVVPLIAEFNISGNNKSQAILAIPFKSISINSVNQVIGFQVI